MAPALIEAAGVASRDRQSNSCNKTQHSCLVGKRLFELKQQKYLVRESKTSVKPTLLTDIPPRVVHSADLNSNTFAVHRSGKADIFESDLAFPGPTVPESGIDSTRSHLLPVVNKDFDMNNSDNGNTSCVVDDETKRDRNNTVMSKLQMNISENELTEFSTERHAVSGNRKNLSNLKRRKIRHHEKLKEIEERLGTLSRRIRTVQSQRIATHLQDQRIESSQDDQRNSTTRALDRFLADQKLFRDSVTDFKGRRSSNSSTTHNFYGGDVDVVDSLTTENSNASQKRRTDPEESIRVLLHQTKLCNDLRDPDATESETEDDDLGEDRGSLSKASSAGWWKDRLQVGSRCSWLESRMADLDQKIKKYEDISRLLKSKRTLLFGSFSGTKNEFKVTADDNSEVQECYKIKASESNRKNGMLKYHTQKQPGKEEGPQLSDSSLSCARILILKTAPTHNYIRVPEKKETKPAYPGHSCPSLPSVGGCQLCQKASPSGHLMVSGNSRAAALDHSYHTKLSFESDVLLPAHLEVALREGGLDTAVKPINNKIVSRKREQEKKRSNSRVALNNLVAAAKAAKIKLSSHGLTQSLPAKLTSRSSLDCNKKRSAAISAANQIEKKARKLTVPREHSSRLSASSTESHQLSTSQPSTNLSQLVKKKRPSSAFDINNIVIPYSIACSTRVEKLKYKEIPTPGWRSIETVSLPKVPKLDEEDEEPEESIDDDNYALRHAVCELEERKRFSVFFQPLRRSRSSRRSSECNTPEPHSPASNDEGRTVPPASTPTDLGQTWVTSGKSGGRNLLWTQLKPEENSVPPWPKRVFPLSDNELIDLEAPSAPPTETDDVATVDSGEPADGLSESESSKRNSPIFSVGGDSPSLTDKDSTEHDNGSFPCLPNDLNELDDESWTVKLLSSEKPSEHAGKNRKGIVLKLAKK